MDQQEYQPETWQQVIDEIYRLTNTEPLPDWLFEDDQDE